MEKCVTCNEPIRPEQKRASTVGIGASYHDECWDLDGSDESDCTHCGGDGWQESDDPLWDGEDEVPCSACAGTGLRKHQSIF